MGGMFTECNVSRLDEGPKPFLYKMTVSTCLDMVLGEIEKGFAIWECCKSRRKLVFQNPFLALFTQSCFPPYSNSLTGVGDLISYWRCSTMQCNSLTGLGDPLLKIFNQCNHSTSGFSWDFKLGQFRAWANGGLSLRLPPNIGESWLRKKLKPVLGLRNQWELAC